jgi:hypothetical protein
VRATENAAPHDVPHEGRLHARCVPRSDTAPSRTPRQSNGAASCDGDIGTARSYGSDSNPTVPGASRRRRRYGDTPAGRCIADTGVPAPRCQAQT